MGQIGSLRENLFGKLGKNLHLRGVVFKRTSFTLLRHAYLCLHEVQKVCETMHQQFHPADICIARDVRVSMRVYRR